MKRIHVPKFRAQLMSGRVARVPGRTWYNMADGPDVAEVMVYDEIGMWGVDAGEFAAALNAITAPSIHVRINSPGGDVFAGVAIYNALVDHPAHIRTEVDGLAASAASVVLMAGDERLVKPGTQVMVHDAWGFAAGNEADMIEFGGVLGGLSNSIADVYAEMAGGTSADWRKTMRAEQWYSADEAVAAGLATAVKTRAKDDTAPQNRWDLSLFSYAGRADAPAPQIAEPFDLDGFRNALKGAFAS